MVAAALAATIALQPSALDVLSAKWDAAWKKPEDARANDLASINSALVEMIAADKLQTGEAFWKASTLYSNPEYQLSGARMRYEWNLTAVALGEKRAITMLPELWDELLMSTGRFRRFGTVKVDYDNAPGQRWWVDKAPKIILDVVSDPAKFRAKDRNPEIAKLVKADQDAREKPWDFSDHEAMMRVMREDRKRLEQIRSLVKKGALYAAADFADAGLVVQHGGTFADYMLAHELALCAYLLGNKGAMWLCGASYDRMLMSASYAQRFCTQYDGKMKMKEYDEKGVNDRMRKAVVGHTLSEMLNPPPP